MAQHDYVIANGTGAAVRSDLNNGLAAIVSQNSGTTEPTTTYAYMRWADTTAGVMKMRNGANNAWITLYQLDGEWSTIAFENGSASAPSIYFKDSGTDTGIYSPGTDQVAISTGGTGRLFVDSSGRVGLGTSSPTAPLDVAESSGSTVRLRRITSGNNVDINFYNPITTAGDVARIRMDGDGVSNAYGALSFWTTQTPDSLVERLRITSAGLVGIGSTSVTGGQVVINSTLDASNKQLVLRDATNGWARKIGVDSSNNMGFYDGDTERMRIDSSGRLLVGTSTSIEANSLIQAYKSSGSVDIRVVSDSLANGQTSTFSAVAGARSSQVGVYKHSGITNSCAYVALAEEDGGLPFLWADNSDVLRISTVDTNIGTTGGTVVGSQTSDERIKNILGPVEYGLDTLKQIEPVRFSLKSEPETEKLGFIAQQVLPLVPQSVFDTKEHIEGEPEDAPTKLGMEYVALIPVLVNAIKELSAEVDALKAQLS